MVSDLREGSPISIQRSYFDGIDGDTTSATLCGFCDASTRAYAAVVYLMVKTDTQTAVRFVVSKTIVAPLQAQTIPRLELLSAFLLAKLIVTVADSLRPSLPQLRIRCYTDSLVALYWIRGINKEWKVFVQNRVSEIRWNVHPSLWSHCPGKSNPADLPSRGLTALEMTVNKLWREGPGWLNEENVTPPTEPETDVMPEECSLELKTHTTRSISLMTTESRSTIEDLMTCQDFSSYSRLLRVTAQVLRAARWFKHGRRSSMDTATTITPGELAEAETLWITSAQLQFVREKDFRQQQGRLRLFQDDKGLCRCGGRLANAEMPFTVKHPILLPRTHPLTTLIVREAHELVFHNRVKETLAETRRKFWILKGRSLTRSIIHRCVVCRRFEGAPFQGPPPPPLPKFRVKDDPAFSYTGV